MKYRKKPIEVEAIKFIGFDNGKPVFSEEPEWLKDALGKEISVVNVGKFPKLTLKTHIYRNRLVTQSDYIIYDGEINALPSCVFEQWYAPI